MKLTVTFIAIIETYIYPRSHWQTKLDENALFLHNLKTAQDDRLLKKPNEAKVPTEQELMIGDHAFAIHVLVCQILRPFCCIYSVTQNEVIGVETVKLSC